GRLRFFPTTAILELLSGINESIKSKYWPDFFFSAIFKEINDIPFFHRTPIDDSVGMKVMCETYRPSQLSDYILFRTSVTFPY
ncbi:hypothetical protein ABTC61_18775, partial [Acinetobacter baumannii]